MKTIAEIDTNFKVETKIEKEGIKFIDLNNPAIKLYGIFKENGKYRRMPEKVAKAVSEGVYRLHADTAGGRVRFKTDSEYVAISVKMDNIGKMPHFAFTGSIGFDLYADNVYEKTFVPPVDITDGYESIVEFADKKIREVTINFPLYTEVCELYIGLDENSVIEPADEYEIQKPVVYYGSSITQGGCASRPGNSYQSIVSRKLNCDYINLGFSGNAKGEDEMAEYIKNLDMSAFVYDYDHNAPNLEHLEKTHNRMFNIIRKANPDLPIIFMTRPKLYLNYDEQARFKLILSNYEEAVAKGDENVYFISGKDLMAGTDNDGTVDNSHPNDLGFKAMADKVGSVLKDILKGE